jgi:hypothetical protein
LTFVNRPRRSSADPEPPKLPAAHRDRVAQHQQGSLDHG